MIRISDDSIQYRFHAEANIRLEVVSVLIGLRLTGLFKPGRVSRHHNRMFVVEGRRAHVTICNRVRE